MSITITASAVQQVNKSITKRGSGCGIRLSVRTSGCSGLAYVMEFVDTIDLNDHKFECGNTLLFVDQKSMLYLDGTELDYTRIGLNEGFKFNNPNVKDSCGCGESFTI